MNSIRGRLAEEVAFQKSYGFQSPPLLESSLTPPFKLEPHDRIYIPRIEEETLTSTIVVNSLTELAEIFEAAKEQSGGRYYVDKDVVIQHEKDHGAAMKHLGQRSVRYAVQVKAKPMSVWRSIRKGQIVRSLGLTPKTLIEDIETTPLGIGMILIAPSEPSPNDLSRLGCLGLSPQEALRLAREYNEKTNSEYYPMPR